MIQVPKQEENENSNDKKKMEDLGSLTCKALSEKKVSDVELIASSKIPASGLHHFYRSF